MEDMIFYDRLQFAFTITFHYIFPQLTMGLSLIIVYFKWKFLKTTIEKYNNAAKFFMKIFAINFTMGVITGIPLEFQFGTNWPGFMEKVGNIAGPLLGYEVLTAFFMEASFLGIMLFGKDRVSERVHLISTVLVPWEQRSRRSGS